MFGPTPQQGRTPLHRQGTRAKRVPRRPEPRPVGLLEVIERRILESLESGAKTLGELSQYHVRGINADLRDEAIESLLKSGRIRLVTIDRKTPNRQPMPAIALPRGEAPRG